MKKSNFQQRFNDALGHGRSVTDALAIATVPENNLQTSGNDVPENKLQTSGNAVPVNKLKLKTANPEYDRQIREAAEWQTLHPPSAEKGKPGNVPQNKPGSQRIDLRKYEA